MSDNKKNVSLFFWRRKKLGANHIQIESVLGKRTLKKYNWLANLFILLLIAFVIALIFVPWQQSAHGHGRVIAFSPTDRQQSINATINGRIAKWYVLEGSHVNAGDLVVALTDNDPNLVKRLNLKKEANELRINAAQKAVDLAKIDVDRQHELYKQGIHSRRQYEASKLNYNKLLNQLANARIALTENDVSIARQESQMVRAPTSGTILRRITGQASVIVKAGQELAILVPDTKSRAVELWLRGNDVPLVQTGDDVRLQFEGWPAVQFSGWPSLAVGTFPGKVKFIDALDDGQGRFRVVVVPPTADAWPDTLYLRQGIRVNGWVLLGRVMLWYELWRRYNGFPPQLPKAPEHKNANPSKA